MLQTLLNAFRDKDIRKKIFLTLGVILIYRIGCFIPIPGLDIAAIQAGASDESFVGIIGFINGGSMSQGSLFSLGILPFINAFIIMQLVTLIIPKLERLSKSGEEGRNKITQITRYVAIGLGMVQAMGFLLSWGDNVLPFIQGVAWTVWITRILVVLILTGGSAFVMWLGERITEYGIGNGTSLLIFVGILSSGGTQVVHAITQISNMTTSTEQLIGSWKLIGFIAFILLLFFFITFIDLSERKIKVSYAKQVKGNKMYGGQSTYIPMRVNSSGVMPIIFASSFLMFPQMIASFWPQSSFTIWWNTYMGVGKPVYIVLMVLLILFFSYFYAQIQFNPIEVSKTIQRNGGFIQGIRPGKPTSDYLANINSRITLFGALFLAVIALIPSIVFLYLGEDLGLTNAFSATGLLIVVSVSLEFDKQLNSQIMMRNYKGFLK